jgi:hypothetical protein
MPVRHAVGYRVNYPLIRALGKHRRNRLTTEEAFAGLQFRRDHQP